MSHQSSHRKVLITGASSGIGAATAVYLSKKQFHVILVARRLERLEALKTQISNSGGKASIYQYDLSLESSRIDLYEMLSANGLLPDILVNNAGLAWYGFFHEMPWQVAKTIIQVNIEALVHLTSLFIPHMVKKQSGHVINVGSIAGKMPEQGISIYSASKAFLDAYTTSLYRELKGTGVHCSVIRPGSIETEFFDAARSQENGGSVPAEKMAIPADCVAIAIWKLIRHPARFRYVPFYAALTPLVELFFSGIIDRIGPLLLNRRK